MNILKQLLLIFIIFCCTTSFAQDNRTLNDSVCVLFQKYFNTENVDSLYALASADYKENIAYNQFKDVFVNDLFHLGAMQTQFESYNNKISRYKATFSGETDVLKLIVNKNGKFQYLLFQPYLSDEKKTVKVASNNSLQTVTDKSVDSIVQPYITLAVTHGLSIGILKDNQTIFYDYGETAEGSKQIPDKRTLFEIGSITKTFTATLLADAVNNGKIKLSDPVNKYLPDSIPSLQYEGVPVTIEMLSNHSSGITPMPSNFDAYATASLNPYKYYGEQQMFSFYKSFKLEHKPGLEYEYSNLAVATLGLILEHIYKKSFEKLVVEKICNPLGMNDTREFIRRNDSSRVAVGYDENGKYAGLWDFDAFAPAGSIRSDASDMLKYAKAQFEEAPSPLNKDIQLTHAVTFKDSVKTVGLGWHYIKAGNEQILFHNGETGGYYSFLGINLSKQVAAIVLSNTAISVDGIGKSLIKYLQE